MDGLAAGPPLSQHTLEEAAPVSHGENVAKNIDVPVVNGLAGAAPVKHGNVGQGASAIEEEKQIAAVVSRQDREGSKQENQETKTNISQPLPSDDVIISRLQGLLKDVDLAVTTEKMLRQQLEAHFAVDLSSKKALLRKEIESYLESQQDDDVEECREEEEEEAAPRKRSRGGATRFGDVLSEQMATFLGLERCPRTQVVKKLWEYIKSNDLQDPKDRRRVLLDDKLKTIFPGKSITMFTMQKHLSKHVFVDDTADDAEHDTEEARRTVKKTAKKAAPSKSRGGGDSGAPKLNGFTKPVKLSPEMASWMGADSAPRPAITKRLWEYVKSNNLQDPSNRQFVLADETLRKLTGEERFQAFGFSKLIKQHVNGYAD